MKGKKTRDDNNRKRNMELPVVIVDKVFKNPKRNGLG